MLLAIIDFIETYLLGPLNYVDRIEGLFKAGLYNDSGYQFIIPRIDKGGQYSLAEVETLLKRYGVPVYWRTYDAKFRYFRVKKRQAVWAEYVMLHAGVELQGPLLEPRNAQYVASHPPGWMPKPWSAGEEFEDGGEQPSATKADHGKAQADSNSLVRVLKEFVEWE